MYHTGQRRGRETGPGRAPRPTAQGPSRAGAGCPAAYLPSSRSAGIMEAISRPCSAMPPAFTQTASAASRPLARAPRRRSAFSRSAPGREGAATAAPRPLRPSPAPPHAAPLPSGALAAGRGVRRDAAVPPLLPSRPAIGRGSCPSALPALLIGPASPAGSRWRVPRGARRQSGRRRLR